MLCYVICVIVNKCLFIEVLCRPLFTIYAYSKPLFTFQNNASGIIPAFHINIYIGSVTRNELLSNYGLVEIIR